MVNPFQRNLIILILVVVVAFNLAVYAGVKLLMSDSFLQLEQIAVKENIHRAVNAIENDLDSLATLNKDWAVWDDTYEFILNNNAAYIESNLVDSTLTELQLNSILFFKSSDDLVFANAMDLREEETVELKRLLNEAMDAGACGWSSQSLGTPGDPSAPTAGGAAQSDFDGTPMPSDVMWPETQIALAEVLGERGEGFIEHVFQTLRAAFSEARQTGARRMAGGDWGELRTARRLRVDPISPGGDG